jgi:hypothetical protein
MSTCSAAGEWSRWIRTTTRHQPQPCSGVETEQHARGGGGGGSEVGGKGISDRSRSCSAKGITGNTMVWILVHWKWLLARKTAAQHRDNRRAFVTTNGCFPSKATKIPRFRGGEPTAFQRKTAKMIQTLGLLGHDREER